MSGLTKQQMINIVDEKKEEIRIAADELSEAIHGLKIGELLDDEKTILVKKKLREIMSKLSFIGGFCDQHSKNWIIKVSNIVAAMTALSHYDYTSAIPLNFFATMASSQIIDFTKTPFRFSGEFKARFSQFEAKVKAAMNRK